MGKVLEKMLDIADVHFLVPSMRGGTADRQTKTNVLKTIRFHFSE